MHKKLEKLLGRYGLFITKHPFMAIVMALMLLAPILYHVPQIKFDTSTEGFMHPDDPVLLEYNKFREQFGRDERIAIAIESEKIFTLPFLQKLCEIHEDLAENVPYVDDITSLYNARNTRGEGDTLITDDLLEPFPQTKEDVAAIKKRAMASHFYKDLFISKDAKMTTIIIETDAYSHEGERAVSEDDFSDGFGDEESAATDTPKQFLTDQENSEVVDAVYKVMKKYQDEGMKIYIAGSPVVIGVLKSQMQADMEKFTKVTFIIIALFLFLMFRRISAVVYPLFVVILSLLSTMGLMAWLGVAFKLPTQIVPSLLLAVSIGATVHALSVFFDRFDATGDKKGSIVFMLEHSGLAITMTSLTTATGIGSFAGSEVAPISDLGIFASFGVLVSLFLTLTLLPALLSITKLKAKKNVESKKLDAFMAKLAIIPYKYTKAVLAISAILVLASLYTATKVHPSHDPLTWLSEGNKVRVATNVIDNHINGTLTLEGVVDFGEENAWIDPKRLQKLNSVVEKIAAYKDPYVYVGKVISLATIVKETNRALHNNDEAYYTIPNDKNLVAQELLLFENSGSDDLEDVVDSQFSKVRITIKVPWVDSIEAVDMLEYVKEELRTTFPEAKTEVTGMVPLLVVTFSHAVHSSITSYIIAFSVISVMMMFIVGSVRLGLVSMIPNLTPVIVGLLVMYIAKIPLDMFTLLIGSIAIGLAVDDTIHFMHNFRRYYLETHDAKLAIEKTFFTAGKAMVITTIVLALGFLSYTMAQMVAVANFGLLTASVIIMALLADLFLAPALMVVVSRWGWIK